MITDTEVLITMTGNIRAGTPAKRRVSTCRRRAGTSLVSAACGLLLAAACALPAADTGIVEALITAINDDDLARPDDMVAEDAVRYGLQGDENTLYVLSDGGLSHPLPGKDLHLNIVKLATNVAGDPIIKGRERVDRWR